jgi:hypothetical protein
MNRIQSADALQQHWGTALEPSNPKTVLENGGYAPTFSIDEWAYYITL